ncbi:hypothetical protein HOT99_gp070 [Caulobacter phage CcrBL10]|uniref:Uncharacterized protein n=1 Tax=Caulobacter phage CcrBL10 TaxID=2283269 RepID=A0A385E8W6_9CAUD|nr:hypothetical protein HOT99_gp070 [Caulobacter phage CcrBL10]AXQ68274.1 hypothetical protein CcrBL10_gp070 [Caulobacter phage CcrBL10]
MSNIEQATAFVGEIAFEASLQGQGAQTSAFVAEFGIDGDSVWWPGYPVAFDPPFRIIGEFGLSLSKSGGTIFPFEFDRGIDDKDALVQALNDAGYEGGGGGTPFDDSFDIVLSDGNEDVSQGAIDLTGLSVGESIVNLDVLLGKLIPPQPAAFPNGTLSISNVAGNDPRLATGFTDNVASGLAAGTSITRITSANVTTFAFNDVGPGNSGTIAALLNGAEAASRILTGTDEGNYSGLIISDQKDYPSDRPGFWKSIDVSLNLPTVPVGVDKIKLTHSAAGQTNEVVFIRDTLTAVPTVSAGSVVQEVAGSLAYSSSVPHYGTGASLTVGMSYNNLAGETYYGGSDPVTISGSNSIIAAKTLSYGSIGFVTPFARNTTAAQAISAQSIAIDGTNVHTSGVIQGVARNVNGASATVTLSSTIILVKRGTATGKIDELSVPVTGMGSTPNGLNALRVGLGAGDTPAGTPQSWDQTAALATHEAACVAGIMGHNQNNYATGYLPQGPNLSVGRSGAQYVTLSFKRAARSTFRIAITGSYAGCWVKLPGVSTAQPNAPNGWWNGFQAYDGAGIPGEAGDPNAGCALGAVMNGTSGTFQITFGTESSTNATNNEILVRLKFVAGQTLTALSFTN